MRLSNSSSTAAVENMATWNSSFRDSSSIEEDLKMEKEKRRRREGKEDPDQKKKTMTWRKLDLKKMEDEDDLHDDDLHKERNNLSLICITMKNGGEEQI